MPETLDRESLKALSTDTRQDIVKMLSQRPYTASELSKKLGKHVTTVTEHLNVLEKSGLIKRKDSTNKWVYYKLSDKGDKLFKPSYYSWVVVLSISAIFIVFGFGQMFLGAQFAAGDMVQAPMMMESEKANASEDRAVQEPFDNLGIILVIIGIIIGVLGVSYLLYKNKKN